jgi:hypothetical protein
MSIRPSLAAVSIAVCAISCQGCAPAYRSVAVPSTDPITAASWKPARVGGEMRVTDTGGVRWNGTVEALGDSVVLRVRYGDISHRHVLATEQIAEAQARPKPVSGESTVPLVFVAVLGILSLGVLALSQMDLN